MAEDEIPVYLKKLQKDGPNEPEDNFTIEDVGWTGTELELDTDTLLKENGQDPHGLLHLLILALVKGQQPTKNAQDVRRTVQKVISEITGERPSRGPTKIGDDEILLDVAVLYFREFYAAGMSDKGIKIKPLIRTVLEALDGSELKSRGSNLENLTHEIAKKFKREKDMYLARATSDNDWDRNIGLVKFRKLQRALRILESIGIPVDIGVAEPTKPSRPTE